MIQLTGQFIHFYVSYILDISDNINNSKNRCAIHFPLDQNFNAILKNISSTLDIGANLMDECFDGIYSGSKKHDPDRGQVLQRAYQIGVQKIILTVGTIFDFESAFKIAASDGKQLIRFID